MTTQECKSRRYITSIILSVLLIAAAFIKLHWQDGEDHQANPNKQIAPPTTVENKAESRTHKPTLINSKTSKTATVDTTSKKDLRQSGESSTEGIPEEKIAAFNQLQKLLVGNRNGVEGKSETVAVFPPTSRQPYFHEDFFLVSSAENLTFAHNPAHRLDIDFSLFREGTVSVRDLEGSPELRIQTLSIDSSIESIGTQQLGKSVAIPAIENSRIEIDRGMGLTEWFVNKEDGLEQGWTLNRPLIGDQVLVEVGFESEGLNSIFDQSLDFGKGGLIFRNKGGLEVYQYDKLAVYDATGKELPSNMMMSPNSTSDYPRVILTTSTRDATFPITIDPVVASSLSYGAPKKPQGSRYQNDETKFANYNGELYFTAYSSSYGYEIWKTDGTPEGTTIALDLVPGPSGSAPQYIQAFNDHLYIVADLQGEIGEEIYKSDGTIEGTELLKDIRPGRSRSIYSNGFVYNGYMYFSGSGAEGGIQLWRTNGTSDGTQPLLNLPPGSFISNPQNFIVFDGNLYFRASGSFDGYEMWKTDGTPSGTSLLKDIYPGNNPFTISLFQNSQAVYKGELYFGASDGVNGKEIWKTDGTEAGTVRFTDLNPNGNSDPEELFVFGNELYFSATDGSTGNELWKTDGTTDGTTQVRDIRTGSRDSFPTSFCEVNGKLVFLARGPKREDRELWTTDGTKDGTKELKDIYPGSESSVREGPIFNYGGKAFFYANTPQTGYELWVTDGTTNGTQLFVEINTGSYWHFSAHRESNPVIADGNFYFPANDWTNGVELWRSNGMPSGTSLVEDLRSGPVGSYPRNLFANSSEVYFAANSRTIGNDVFKYDGSSTTSELLKTIVLSDESATNFASINGKVVFSAYDSTAAGVELWVSDGTEAGTHVLKDISPGRPSSQPGYFTHFNGYLYFSAADQLWKTDGTSTGTELVNEAGPRFRAGSPVGDTNTPLNIYNGELYYLSSLGTELWKSDGTNEGTTLVKDGFQGYRRINPYFGVEFSDELYFQGNVGDEVTLWKTDGTPNGTVPVNNDVQINLSLVVLNGELFFGGFSDGYGLELWKTDGTDQGTVLVKDIFPGNFSSRPTELTVFNNKLYFGATDPEHGQELWVSDGTEEGTVLVEDFNQGTSDAGALWLTAVEGVSGIEDGLYYFATDGDNNEHFLKLTDSFLDLDNESDTGVSSIDDITNDTTPLFVGTTDPGATVEVLSNLDGSLGTVLANGSTGDWSLTAPTMSEGDHRISTKFDGVASGGSLIITIDTTPPNVTVEQATSQADPAAAGPVEFVANFSEDVFDFAATDVVAGGNAGGIVDITGGPSVYEISVQSSAPEGFTNAVVPMMVCTDTAGNHNTASTSTDNEVVLDPDGVNRYPNPTTFTNDQSAVSGFLTSPIDTDTFTFTLTGPRIVMLQTTGGTDTIGTLRDADGNLINVPANDQDAGTGPNFLVTEFLPPGAYTIEISGTITGAYDLEIDAQTQFTIQPDLITQGAGDGVYETFAGQTVFLNSRKAKPVRFAIAVENDGDIADTLSLSGTRGNKFFIVAYSSANDGNVTGAMFTGTHEIAADSMSEGDTISVLVRPKKGKLRKVRRKKNGKRVVKFLKKAIFVSIQAESDAWSERGDLGRVRVKVR